MQNISDYKKGDSVTKYGKWILAENNLYNVPCRPGVYFIVIDNEISYIGSAERLAFRIYCHEKLPRNNNNACIYFLETNDFKTIEMLLVSEIQPKLNKIWSGENTVLFRGKRYKIQDDKNWKHIIVIENKQRKKYDLKLVLELNDLETEEGWQRLEDKNILNK